MKWNPSWKLRTHTAIHLSPFILSWDCLECHAMNRCQDVSDELLTQEPRQRRHPGQLWTLREDWYQGATDDSTNLASIVNPDHMAHVLAAAVRKNGISCCLCPRSCNSYRHEITFPANQTWPCPYREIPDFAIMLYCYQIMCCIK